MSLRLNPGLEEARRESKHVEVTPAEESAMLQAIRLARRGVGSTHPNPRVGAVVLRDGTGIATGYHLRAGESHAEARALARAAGLARGATLVVTLEPCAHWGRTPPCVDAIITSGIRRVVIGMRDPNPLVDGRGIDRLRRAGVEVVVGLNDGGCRALNPPYLKQLRTGLPWVTLKAMVSLDGRMASESGESRGLGGEAEQRLVHRLRAESDAVIVGVGTVLADDPLLTVRLSRGRTPLRILLDSTLRTSPAARIVTTAKESSVVIATTSSDAERIHEFESRSVSVWRFEPSPEGRVPLGSLLTRLAGEGRYSILVEGGASVHTSFLREGLADGIAVGVAPIVLGGSRAASFVGSLGHTSLSEGIPLEGFRARRVGRDFWLEGTIAQDGGDRV